MDRCLPAQGQLHLYVKGPDKLLREEREDLAGICIGGLSGWREGGVTGEKVVSNACAGSLRSEADRVACGNIMVVRSRNTPPGSPALLPGKRCSPGYRALCFSPYRVLPGLPALARGHVLRQERCHQI